MKITFTKIERGAILDCVMSLQGVSRSDALLLRSVDEKLKLQETAVLRSDEFEENSEYELNEVETEWLLGVVDRQFKASAVNPRLSSALLSAESKLGGQDESTRA